VTVKISKKAAEGGLIGTVSKMSGVDLSACYQCRKCSSGCPVARYTQSPPSEIIRRLHLGAGNELLKSDIIWMCLSCETCYARCPMEINTAAVIDALRALAVARGAPVPKGNAPLFNRAFLSTVKTFGRAYELPMILAYKLRTLNLIKDMDKLPAMLKKGKMALLPPSGADRLAVKRMFRQTRPNKEARK
jgi:heterodisulfide reductase subunit C